MGERPIRPKKSPADHSAGLLDCRSKHFRWTGEVLKRRLASLRRSMSSTLPQYTRPLLLCGPGIENRRLSPHIQTVRFENGFGLTHPLLFRGRGILQGIGGP